MAEFIYSPGTGTSTAVAQVATYTPATIQATDIFTLTASADNGDTAVVSFTATDTSATTTSAGLIAAWNASTHRLCTGITASGSSTVILTADTPGVPFSVASSTTDGGGANTQTFTGVATTANVGQSDVGLAANYYGNALPGNSGDSLTIDGRNVAALAYGKNRSAQTYDLFRIWKSNAYNVGLAPSSTNPTAEYLRAGATATKIGEAPSDGSTPSGASFIAHDGGTVAGTWTIYDSNQTGVNGLPVVLIKAINASNVLNLVGNAAVGVAVLNPGEASTFATINQDGQGSRLTIGSGVTLTTLTQTKGFCELRCAATTVTQDGGELKTTGSGAITTLKVGGKADLQSTGTVTTITVMSSGDLNCSNQDAARTITTINAYPGAKINIACSGLTITNPIHVIGGSLKDVTITTNKNIDVTIA